MVGRGRIGVSYEEPIGNVAYLSPPNVSETASFQIMQQSTGYVDSLRGKAKVTSRIEEGVPFFVPELAKVKTSIVCTRNHQDLRFVFENTPKSNMSYRKQGDVRMYTTINIRRRQQLRTNRQILANLERFWDTFNSVRHGTKVVSKEEYITVFLKMFKALVRPEEFCVQEAKKIIAKDWERDNAQAQQMSKRVFLKSLFEVADIWTTVINAEAYCAFLDKLFQRITVVVYDQERAMYYHQFASLDAIQSLYDSTMDETPTKSINTTIKAVAKTMSSYQRNKKTPKPAARLVRSKTDVGKILETVPPLITREAWANMKKGGSNQDQKKVDQKVSMPSIYFNPSMDKNDQQPLPGLLRNHVGIGAAAQRQRRKSIR